MRLPRREISSLDGEYFDHEPFGFGFSHQKSNEIWYMLAKKVMRPLGGARTKQRKRQRVARLL